MIFHIYSWFKQHPNTACVCPIITPWAITTNPGVFFNFPFLKSLSSLEFQLILQIAQVFDDFFGPLPGKLCTVSTGVVMVKGVFFFGTIFYTIATSD